MKTSCDNDQCCTETAGCETASCSSGSDCCTDNCSSDCPVEHMAKMWGSSFGQAIKEAQVEVLKAKILKAWGPMLDQGADSLLETMSAVWASKQADIRVAEAKQAFQQRLRDLMLAEKKK